MVFILLINSSTKSLFCTISIELNDFTRVKLVFIALHFKYILTYKII
jgi:hypothetical protein